MVTAIKLLLGIVSLLMRWADEAKLKKVGEDAYVRKTLVELSVRSRIAKQIDVSAAGLNDTDVNRILRDYYRNEGQ